MGAGAPRSLALSPLHPVCPAPSQNIRQKRLICPQTASQTRPQVCLLGDPFQSFSIRNCCCALGETSIKPLRVSRGSHAEISRTLHVRVSQGSLLWSPGPSICRPLRVSMLRSPWSCHDFWFFLVYSREIHWSGLHNMVHVVQQWLSHTREAKNPIVAQSMRLDASEVWSWRPGEFLVFSLKQSDPENRSQECPVACVLADSRCGQVDWSSQSLLAAPSPTSPSLSTSLAQW